MDKNKIVVKCNRFVSGTYRLTPTEHRILLVACSLVNSMNDEFKSLELNIGRFCSLFGIRVNHSDLDDITDRLLESFLKIKTEEGWKKYSIVLSAEYNRYKGAIILKFSPEMKPFLLGLRKEFTKYELGAVLDLDFVSFRIYELCKQFQFIKKRTFGLEEFADILEVGKSYYRFDNLKKFVLDPSLKKINETTDLKVSVSYQKKVRKVTGLIFEIEERVKKEVSSEKDFIESFMEDLFQENFKEPDRAVYEHKDERRDRIERYFKKFGSEKVLDLYNSQVVSGEMDNTDFYSKFIMKGKIR